MKSHIIIQWDWNPGIKLHCNTEIFLTFSAVQTQRVHDVFMGLHLAPLAGDILAYYNVKSRAILQNTDSTSIQRSSRIAPDYGPLAPRVSTLDWIGLYPARSFALENDIGGALKMQEWKYSGSGTTLQGIMQE